MCHIIPAQRTIPWPFTTANCRNLSIFLSLLMAFEELPSLAQETHQTSGLSNQARPEIYVSGSNFPTLNSQVLSNVDTSG